MVLQYLFACLRGLVFPSAQTTPRVPLYLFLIITMSIVSIIISEGFLAFFAFNELATKYGYSHSESALLSAGIFFLQFLLAAGLGCYIIKGIASKSYLTEKSTALKNTVAAFTNGFNSR